MAAEAQGRSWWRVPTHGLMAATRIAFGWIFLWAFLDKWLGLGFATARDNAWIRGGSPTSGFLQFANPDGPLAGFFAALDTAFVEWLFMLGLLGVGLTFATGIALRLGAAAGATMLVLMWLALLPVENNPFLDNHLVYALAMILLAALDAGRYAGLGRQWQRLTPVRERTWLH